LRFVLNYNHKKYTRIFHPNTRLNPYCHGLCVLYEIENDY